MPGEGMPLASIASAPIDHMGERLAAFARLDLPGDQGGCAG